MKKTVLSRGLDLTVALVVVGTAMVILGVVTGFVGVGPECGSAFSGGNTFLQRSVLSCEFAAAESRREAVQLIVGGGLLLLGVALVGKLSRTEARDEDVVLEES